MSRRSSSGTKNTQEGMTQREEEEEQSEGEGDFDVGRWDAQEVGEGWPWFPPQGSCEAIWLRGTVWEGCGSGGGSLGILERNKRIAILSLFDIHRPSSDT